MLPTRYEVTEQMNDSVLAQSASTGAPAQQVEDASQREAKLSVDGVRIDFRLTNGALVHAVEDITLRVHDHDFVCIVGPSGCGKSSLLNVVAGLRPPTAGAVQLDGRPVTGPGRDRAFVFQQAALLPWRTTLRNVAYGLELAGVSKGEARKRSMDALALVGLSGAESRYPAQLSGGMQQRVNLARALVVEPEVLLLDEPFAALDSQTREVMQQELLRIWEQTRSTALFVTHQISEAVYLADRIVVLSKPPSRVAAVIDVDIPRPRDRTTRHSAAFRAIEDRVDALLHDDDNGANSEYQ